MESSHWDSTIPSALHTSALQFNKVYWHCEEIHPLVLWIIIKNRGMVTDRETLSSATPSKQLVISYYLDVSEKVKTSKPIWATDHIYE